jgi:hypothetical protein
MSNRHRECRLGEDPLGLAMVAKPPESRGDHEHLSLQCAARTAIRSFDVSTR